MCNYFDCSALLLIWLFFRFYSLFHWLCVNYFYHPDCYLSVCISISFWNPSTCCGCIKEIALSVLLKCADITMEYYPDMITMGWGWGNNKRVLTLPSSDFLESLCDLDKLFSNQTCSIIQKYGILSDLHNYLWLKNSNVTSVFLNLILTLFHDSTWLICFYVSIASYVIRDVIRNV